MKNKLIFTLLAAAISTGAMAKNEKEHKEHKEHKAEGKHKSLPPGLQKKVARGEPLPPGWQKKYHRGDVLDIDHYDRGTILGPIGRDGEVTIKIDDTLFKIHDKTRKILDIINN